MATKKLETLVSPDGNREWDPEDAVQSNNLRARGWKAKSAIEAEAKAKEEAEAKQAATEAEADKNAAESRPAKSSTTSAK